MSADLDDMKAAQDIVSISKNKSYAAIGGYSIERLESELVVRIAEALSFRSAPGLSAERR